SRVAVHPGPGESLSLPGDSREGGGSHRKGRRRSHQQSRQKISRQGRLSFPAARRKASHLQDRAPQIQRHGLSSQNSQASFLAKNVHGVKTRRTQSWYQKRDGSHNQPPGDHAR